MVAAFPKKHHYLPQFYLRRFANDDGKLWVFDRETKSYRCVTPKEVGQENHFYTFIDKDGKKNGAIETYFSDIETYASNIIEKLLRLESLTKEEKGNFSSFIAFQRTRTPEYEKTLNEMTEKQTKAMLQIRYTNEEQVGELLKRYEKSTGRETGLLPKEYLSFIHGNKMKISLGKNESLRQMLDHGERTASCIANMEWEVVHSMGNSSFITTDNPFIIGGPAQWPKFYGVGLTTPGTKKLVPLTSKLCLLMGDAGHSVIHKQCDQAFVRAANLDLAEMSDRILISGAKPLLKRIVELTKVDESRRGDRIRVSIGGKDIL